MDMTADAHLMMRNLAHDVRAPLNAIAGFSLLLESESHGPLNAEQREFVSRIHLAAFRAAAIVSSMQQLTQAEEGSLPVIPEPTPLRPLVGQLIDEQAALIEQSGLVIEARLDEVGHVRTDPELLARVVSNLLSNATRHNRQGGRICVQLEQVNADSSPLQRDSVAIRVADNGPGISPADQERVFKEFVRLPASVASGGSGLGLAIGRRIARLLRGDLLLRSWPGAGSEFTLWLPADYDVAAGRRG